MTTHRILVPALALAILLALPAAETREPPGPIELKKTDFGYLLERAKRHPLDNVQIKMTWCGEQTKSIPTVVLGTPGKRLFVEKYDGLRRPRWHYGNDHASSVGYFQVPWSFWPRCLEALHKGQGGLAWNPAEVPEKDREGWHVVVSWTGFLEREVRYLEAFTRGDTSALEKTILDALGEHPLREHLERVMFLR